MAICDQQNWSQLFSCWKLSSFVGSGSRDNSPFVEASWESNSTNWRKRFWIKPFLMILTHTDSIPSGSIKFRTMEHLNLDVHGAKWSLLQKLESWIARHSCKSLLHRHSKFVLRLFHKITEGKHRNQWTKWVEVIKSDWESRKSDCNGVR